LPTVDLEAFPMRFPLLLCPFFAVAVALPSQTTHLVGPGGLAQIRDALAIAQPGDRIHVQPGTYAHFTATVGVTIRALAPGSVVVRYDTAYAPPTCPFCVDEGPTRFAIPAGQTAHVVGIHFEASAPTIVFAPIFHRVEVQSGRVHFEDCILATRRFQALQIAQAAQVHLNATTVAGFGGPLSQGASGIRVLGGTLTAVGCQIGGGAGSSPVDGAGLAAPQIGVDMQLVIFGFTHTPRYPGREAVPQTVLLNPVITPLADELVEGWEGCLSVPGLRGLVPRHPRVRYAGQDLQGRPIEREVGGFHAVVVQHECDHLVGRLYPTRMTAASSLGFVEELTDAGRMTPRISVRAKAHLRGQTALLDRLRRAGVTLV
jgi:peptide deformylase